MSDPNIYTVGWICAISTEYTAALAFLDEKHEGPKYVSQNDSNNYTLGRIGRHNCVIAVLPIGEYGTASAAGVAAHMLHTFPNIRIGLMVGIGGGAPSRNNDIRLGDVIVGASSNGKASVFQYDFGKAVQSQEFLETGFLNNTPTVLRTAINGLKAYYESEGNQLNTSVNEVLNKKPKLYQRYKRPKPDTDRLYLAHIVHPLNDNSECKEICGNDISHFVMRPERIEDINDPVVHYGIIASANTLMKDAQARDALIAKRDVLCFEMEAAGLMNDFPCVVIRGVCDYSDSHNNQEWQGYAAMASAAYAKALLSRISPTKIETEKTIGDILSEVQNLQKEQECHQLFRLTTSDRDVTYERYKDRVQQRIEDTCMWFLNHKNYQKWLNRESGPLIITADPGCGKSVLAKYLVDHDLPRSAIICYFFFKDKDQNTIRQALCAIIHQLIEQNFCLVKHAMAQHHKDGRHLIHSTESLWKVFLDAVDDPQAGTVIIVLDALDECEENEFADLMRNIDGQFRINPLKQGKLKYLLTCRPYEHIVSKFYDLTMAFPNICITGEENSEEISREVSHVITHRVNQLSEKKKLSNKITTLLEKKLKYTPNRTYLWAYLIFDYLENESFKLTEKGAESVLENLPGTVNRAYEKILNKTKEDPMVRKVLSIIMAASRPLTILEMNIAVNIDATVTSFDDLDLEDEVDFKNRLRSWCGLFVSVHHGKIEFIHQTARDFLLTDVKSTEFAPSELRWEHSISYRQAHAILAEICVLYLNLFNTKSLHTRSGDPNDSGFLHYCASNWGSHFRQAQFENGNAIMLSTLRIYDSTSKSYQKWFGIYCQTANMQATEGFSHLIMASHFGHDCIAKLHLKKRSKIDEVDTKYGRTPLLWAAVNGHDSIIKLLLERGAKIEAKDNISGRTALLWAAKNGHKAAVELLIKRGAQIEAKDKKYGRTPLLWAARHGHRGLVISLLDKGANIEAKDTISRCTPLMLATLKGHGATAKLLLDRGAVIEGKRITPDRTNRAYQAARVVKRLLQHEPDSDDGKSLLWAARHGHMVAVELFLDKGVKIESKDENNWTPLFWATENAHRDIIKLLLKRGANIETLDDGNQTPLLVATKNGDEKTVKLLLKMGAKIEARDKNLRTPLLWAVTKADRAMPKLLLEKRASIETRDVFGNTPLISATENGHSGIVKLLIDNGADIEARDINGHTPLMCAVNKGQEKITGLLLEHGADADAVDGERRSLYDHAVQKGQKAIIKLVYKYADI